MEKLEPKVELIQHTQDAVDLLVFSKSSRLTPGITFEQVKKMSMDEKRDHIEYMLNTIKSSFEFVHYTFHITNVSRAFTHQLIRTREAAYQQQAMRVVDARNFGYLVSSDMPEYQEAFDFSLKKYGEMIDKGEDVQNARGILGTGIHTQIMSKFHLRELGHMAELRLCKRAEGEYQKVFKMMVAQVLELHPWAEPLLNVYCVKYGSCAFPLYTKCPIQQYCFDPSTIRDRIKYEWENSSHQAAPKANEKGMTM